MPNKIGMLWRKSVKNIEKLYQQISEVPNDEFYLLEPEFCEELYYHISIDNRPLCVTAFITILNWFAMSQRSGVWTFYESTSPKDIELTIHFLEQTGDDELASIFRYGAHDYQNPKYNENWNYPDEWIDEANKIDDWITNHESWLYMWERKLLIDNKELLCSLVN